MRLKNGIWRREEGFILNPLRYAPASVYAPSGTPPTSTPHGSWHTIGTASQQRFVNSQDWTGYAYGSAAYSSSTTPHGTSGRGCIDFPNADSRIVVFQSYGGASLGMVAWVYFDDLDNTSRYRIFGKPANGSDVGELGLDPTNTTTLKTKFRYATQLSGVTYTYNVTHGFTFQTGVWYHIGFKYQGSTLTFWVNGVSVTQSVPSGSSINTSNGFGLGANGNCFDGKIAAATFWQDANLSQSHIDFLYSHNPYAYWTANQSGGLEAQWVHEFDQLTFNALPSVSTNDSRRGFTSYGNWNGTFTTLAKWNYTGTQIRYGGGTANQGVPTAYTDLFFPSPYHTGELWVYCLHRHSAGQNSYERFLQLINQSGTAVFQVNWDRGGGRNFDIQVNNSTVASGTVFYNDGQDAHVWMHWVPGGTCTLYSNGGTGERPTSTDGLNEGKQVLTFTDSSGSTSIRRLRLGGALVQYAGEYNTWTNLKVSTSPIGDQ